MNQTDTKCNVTVNDVRELIARNGYEIVKEEGNSIQVRELESNVMLNVVLEDDILFNTVACMTVPSSEIPAEMMKTMLSADNGISTSSFQIYDLGNGKSVITLNNFAKLQEMGDDDEDDILSCLSFLIVDAMAARKLLTP